MAIFLDTGAFVAARNLSDRNHARATELLEKALSGEFGVVYTSDFVVDEAITTALFRTRDFRLAVNVGRLILESPRIERLQTDSDEFLSAWQRFQKFGKKPMSFTDCVSLAHMERHGIQRIMSFDSEFDGLSARTH